MSERTVRITAIDHALGKRVTYAEFRRVPSLKHAARLIVAAYGAQGWTYLELPEADVKMDDGWHKLNVKGPLFRWGH